MFWRSLRDHCQTKRIKLKVQEVQRKAKSVCPTIISEPWRHRNSDQRPEIPYVSFKRIKNYIDLCWIQEIPDNGNDPNRRNKTLLQERAHTPKKNIIIYRLIWGHFSPAIQSKLEGDPEYIKHSPTKNFLWLFTKVKICTHVTYHTSNGYHSEVMTMRTIVCLKQGWDDPTEAYYIRFEADISRAETAKCNATTHMELNKTYTGGDYEGVTKRFQAMCLSMYYDSERYTRTWNCLKKITLLSTYNYPRSTTGAYDILFCHKKPTPQCQVHATPDQSRLSNVVMQITAR